MTEQDRGTVPPDPATSILQNTVISNRFRSAAYEAAAGYEPAPQIEMLTPKGEHPFPLFYQGDVRWENQFRRNRNSAKNLW